MSDQTENRKTLFGGNREFSFMNSIATEFQELVQEQTVEYWAIERKYTRAHKLYGEARADKKAFRQPVKIYCTVKLDEPDMGTTRSGTDRRQTITVFAQRERLVKDLNMTGRRGDFLRYDNQWWEIHFVDDRYGQFVAQPDFKFNIKIQAHLTRLSDVNVINLPVTEINNISQTGSNTTITGISVLGFDKLNVTYPLVQTVNSGLMTITLAQPYIDGSAFDYRFMKASQQFILSGDVIGNITGNLSVVAIQNIPVVSGLTAGASIGDIITYTSAGTLALKNPPITTSISGEGGVTSNQVGNTYFVGLKNRTRIHGGTFYNGSQFSATASNPVWVSDVSAVLTSIKCFSDALGVTINAKKNSSNDHLLTDYAISPINTWQSTTGTLQNINYVPGDYLSVDIRSIFGTNNPTKVAIQVEFTEL